MADDKETKPSATTATEDLFVRHPKLSPWRDLLPGSIQPVEDDSIVQ